MTWIDNNGETRPQSWEEYCEMAKSAPDWSATRSLMIESLLHGALRAVEPLHPSPRRTGKEESREKVLRMRQRLFRADPHCFWCGQVTLYGAVGDPLQATVDHLYSRLHPERMSRYQEQKGVLHVLACSVCNNERGVCEQQRRPFVPKLKERLEFARLADATLAGVVESGVPGLPVRDLVPKKPMRVICTLQEAIEFARDNPAR